MGSIPIVSTTTKGVVTMTTAVIVDAVRSPLGKRNGRLKNWHPVDLAAEVMNSLVERTGVDPARIDDVVLHLGYTARDGGSALKDAVLKETRAHARQDSREAR